MLIIAGAIVLAGDARLFPFVVAFTIGLPLASYVTGLSLGKALGSGRFATDAADVAAVLGTIALLAQIFETRYRYADTGWACGLPCAGGTGVVAAIILLTVPQAYAYLMYRRALRQ